MAHVGVKLGVVVRPDVGVVVRPRKYSSVLADFAVLPGMTLPPILVLPESPQFIPAPFAGSPHGVPINRPLRAILPRVEPSALPADGPDSVFVNEVHGRIQFRGFS